MQMRVQTVHGRLGQLELHPVRSGTRRVLHGFRGVLLLVLVEVSLVLDMDGLLDRLGVGW